jgi:hypothetical protein
MIKRDSWNRGASVLFLAGMLGTPALGCSGAGGEQEAEAPAVTRAVRANMVYYAMPG